jgi:hypothetical protein
MTAGGRIDGFSGPSKSSSPIPAFFLPALVESTDHLTGNELSLSFFYLAPAACRWE